MTRESGPLSREFRDVCKEGKHNLKADSFLSFGNLPEVYSHRATAAPIALRKGFPRGKGGRSQPILGDFVEKQRGKN